MAKKQAPRLSGEQISEVLPLIKGADSVELKLTVPDADRRSAVAALEIDALDAQMRQVMFFDLAGGQQTKTRTALEYFAGELQAAKVASG